MRNGGRNIQRNSLRELSMWYADFVLAASVSPPANVKPTSVVSIVVPSYRSATGWTLVNPRNGLRGSSVKNGEPLQTLD